MAIIVQRWAQTGHDIRIEPTSPKLGWGITPGARTGAINIHFSIASSGGGVTNLHVSISPEHFEEVATLMITANPTAAAAAFASATAVKLEGGMSSEC